MTGILAPVSEPCLLALDPGRDKTGYAVLTIPAGLVLRQGVVATNDLSRWLAEADLPAAMEVVVLGDATGSLQVHPLLQGWNPGIEVCAVDESHSTLEARALYWETHPPTGWRRWIPRTLLVPPRPVDDFAAVVLGRRYLAGTHRSP